MSTFFISLVPPIVDIVPRGDGSGNYALRVGDEVRFDCFASRSRNVQLVVTHINATGFVRVIDG